MENTDGKYSNTPLHLLQSVVILANTSLKNIWRAQGHSCPRLLGILRLDLHTVHSSHKISPSVFSSQRRKRSYNMGPLPWDELVKIKHYLHKFSSEILPEDKGLYGPRQTRSSTSGEGLCLLAEFGNQVKPDYRASQQQLFLEIFFFNLSTACK